MTIAQKTVLISGATGGLGKAVTNTFLGAGATVIISYRNKEDLPPLEEGLIETDRKPVYIKADLSREESVNALFKRISRDYHSLDLLIHLVGGFWMGGEVAETPIEKWNFMMTINLMTTFLCTREAFALMKRGSGGKIFTVSSRAALDIRGGTGAYTVSKAAVLALTQVLAKEGIKYNIQANCLLPSVIDTPANRSSMPDADFNTWVKPEEIAGVLLSLVSDNATTVLSGNAIKVYGKA